MKTLKIGYEKLNIVLILMGRIDLMIVMTEGRLRWEKKMTTEKVKCRFGILVLKHFSK